MARCLRSATLIRPNHDTWSWSPSEQEYHQGTNLDKELFASSFPNRSGDRKIDCACLLSFCLVALNFYPQHSKQFHR
ncbi:uncharacterized protein PHALS_05345 [Plasmopara halstedii]|uniref:Uncharacterized protein n=1 Tax=Plasmopara halstedii TaxID=4781 RepID=A0A0P1AB70_PLAHL|nr:uncharacterized protein PHALS_05345 [Plasmopara halstedii]CEG37565.1 hypothetical protein PHALS_05345 [Plasmopara halstedii]|eukprot:XP_024573934.1 hypothetical protein PHALS_05345 [Plasmopara halstedii]